MSIPNPKKCLECLDVYGDEYDNFNSCPHYRHDMIDLKEWKEYMRSEIAKSIIEDLENNHGA